MSSTDPAGSTPINVSNTASSYFGGPCVDQTFSFVLFMLYLLVFNYIEVSLLPCILEI